MIVKTQSGTVYEFRIRELDVTEISDAKPKTLSSGWEGRRLNLSRVLHKPINEWTPVKLPSMPEIGLSFPMEFEGLGAWDSTPVQLIEISDKERDEFGLWRDAGDGVEQWVAFKP